MITNTDTNIKAPVRALSGRVDLFNRDSTSQPLMAFTDLIDLSIERIGDETKFFGYGICQRIKANLADFKKSEKITNSYDSLYAKLTSTQLDFSEGLKTNDFDVTYFHHDEVKGIITIIGYDAIYRAANYTFADLGLTAPYTIYQVAQAASNLLLGTDDVICDETMVWSHMYNEGANYEGSESLRDVLDDIAEATQSIYFINYENKLVFKVLDIINEAVYTIGREDYSSLVNKDNRRLSQIVHTTELGDNISASSGVSGTTQYIRDNPFWNNREDVAELVQEGFEKVRNLTINQFDCVWRGNFWLEIGDKINLVGREGEIFTSYILNDVIEFNGGLIQKTQWQYTNTDTETAAAPSTLGEAIKETYAKVDKVNREIELVARDMEKIPQEMSSIKLTTDAIVSSVQSVEKEIGAQGDRITDVEGAIENLSTSLEQTAEQIKIEIKEEIMEEGTSVAVETITGFTFNENGLTVEKTGSEMSTNIDEDGMTIYRDDTEVLVADNTGVYAANLRATTYLIVGVNSRFEDYDNNQRTGCFWIGGVNN